MSSSQRNSHRINKSITRLEHTQGTQLEEHYVLRNNIKDILHKAELKRMEHMRGNRP